MILSRISIEYERGRERELYMDISRKEIFIFGELRDREIGRVERIN